MEVKRQDDSIRSKIQDYVYNEIHEIEKLTGKPVEIAIVENLSNNVDALTKVARESMPKSTIYIKKDNMPFINHLILHECGHIKRIFSVHPSERLQLGSKSRGEETKIYTESLNHFSKLNIPKQNIIPIVSDILFGLTQQIFNTIPDIFIEQDIYNRHPENRVEQKRYLLKLYKTLEECISPKVQQFMPKQICEANSGVTLLFINNIKNITGTTLLNKYKQNGIAKRGYAKISNIEIKDTGYNGDIKAVNEICKAFGLTHVSWIPFNHIPFNYENTY